jgi:hypothetical protein
VRAIWIGSCAGKELLSSPSARTARTACVVRLMVGRFRKKGNAKRDASLGVNKQIVPSRDERATAISHQSFAQAHFTDFAR